MVYHPSTTLATLAAALLAVPAAAQLQRNSSLDRGDIRLSNTLGVINSSVASGANNNADAGFGTFTTRAPKQFLPERPAQGLVATPRLVYSVHADAIQGNVVLQFLRSTDGGRNWEARRTVYTCNTAGGETLETYNSNSTGGSEIGLWCHGDQVWVTWLTDDFATPAATSGMQRLYAAGSADQGQTWSAPFLVSNQIGTTQFDVDVHLASAASTGLHLVFEHDAMQGANEDFSYARLELQNGAVVATVPEVQITNFAGAIDVDNPSVAAQDNVVLIAWNDTSALGSQDDTFSIHSFDGGVTFSTPFNHTNFPQASTWATARAPLAFVSLPYAFVFMEDSRVLQDDIWMDRGDVDTTTNTLTWSVQAVQCNRTPPNPAVTGGAGFDVDGKVIDVDGATIAILYRDDRFTAANSNEAYIVCDRAFGNEFLANMHVEHPVSTLTATIYDIQVCRNVVAAVWEQCSGDEEGAIALSHDGGVTFDAFQFTTLGDCGGSANVDIDDCFVAVTQNGDYTVVYADERLGGNNASNGVFLTGGKYPYLRDLTSQNGTLEMWRSNPVDAPTSIAFLIISGAGTTPGQRLFNNDYGVFVGIENDVWFNLLLNNAGITMRPVTPTGDTVFSIPGVGFPNLTQLLGFPIDVAAVTFDLSPRPLRSYTDPVRF